MILVYYRKTPEAGRKRGTGVSALSQMPCFSTEGWVCLCFPSSFLGPFSLARFLLAWLWHVSCFHALCRETHFPVACPASHAPAAKLLPPAPPRRALPHDAVIIPLSYDERIACRGTSVPVRLPQSGDANTREIPWNHRETT